MLNNLWFSSKDSNLKIYCRGEIKIFFLLYPPNFSGWGLMNYTDERQINKRKNKSRVHYVQCEHIQEKLSDQ